MNNIRKLSLTAMITALTALTSSFIFIPAGVAKIFPIQHLANVLTAVMLGPAYALAQAFIVSLLRNLAGTGSVFAFPGSMIGALLAAWLYKKTKRITFACLGEVVGTGVIGALACYPIAILFLGEKVALLGFLPAFTLSSFTGATIAFVLLKIFLKNSYLEGKIYGNRRL
ncbi:energy coupling factor transporter S component ThiW [Peribacillus cavernae]|uniref:Energy coupling factor transporter S component ThiW n=1 Tax=Peribacillus cavernae TaxID=1674310 RepID=A0A3S0U3K9_9BACI|nr:energy coupling factor transporter S component ThiW [Peribacillus cavernae]MDQ0217354.1 energy coupling factor transporter S component ThiW [Peribacillus cavernae]RUQ30195.1 energy coupling factor transporter S component ThiW [Peribacillus cavernae]